MSHVVFELRKLSVSAAQKSIIKDLNLAVGAGEVHVLLGANGSGKSSILSAIMGLAPFEVTGGTILYKGSDISRLSIDQRAQLGIGLAFQHPPTLAGVTVAAFAAALDASETLAREERNLDLPNFRQRELAVGFSGGESKRWELLKLFLQQPELILLDEPESGVDLEHIAQVGAAIDRLLTTPTVTGNKRAALLITHTGLILDYVQADKAHILADGRIVHSGEPKAVFRHVQQQGYIAPAD